MRLILIRHPRTEANEQKLVYGRTDALYSESGKATIPGIVEALHAVNIDQMYSSPLTRTRLLAREIAFDHRISEEQIRMDDRILEMDFGKFENMTIPQLEATYPKEYQEYINDFNEYVVPGGESYRQLYERVGEFLKEIYRRHEQGIEEEKHRDALDLEVGEGTDEDHGWFEVKNAMASQERKKEETVVVVAHSMVIHAALAHLLNLDLNDVWHIKTEPGSIVDLDWRYEFAMLQSLSGPFNVRETR